MEFEESSGLPENEQSPSNDIYVSKLPRRALPCASDKVALMELFLGVGASRLKQYEGKEVQGSAIKKSNEHYKINAAADIIAYDS